MSTELAPIVNREFRVSEVNGIKTISGYAAVFYREEDAGTTFDLGGGLEERIMPGAFDAALAEGQDVRALYNHEPDNLLGRMSAGTLAITVDAVGLRYNIPLDESDPDHQRVASKISRGDLAGSSFGFRIRDGGEKFSRQDGKTVRELRSLDLIDVGPVTFPAYTSTEAGFRSAHQALDAWKNQALAGYKSRGDDSLTHFRRHCR